MVPEERRRFTLLNIPRRPFSEASAVAARRAANPVLHPRRAEEISTSRLNLAPASSREGGPLVSLSRWSGIQVGFAASLDRASRADDDFAHCGWLARRSRRGRLGYDGGNRRGQGRLRHAQGLGTPKLI